MNNTSIVFRTGRLACAAGWLWAVSAQALPATGEAIVAARTGQATARVFTGPVHEGRTTVKDLFEGAALGENSRLMTGQDGRLCTVFSPGAIVCVAPNTEFTIRQLRHTADGLPKSEADLVRRIHLELHRGRIRVQSGVPMPTMDIRILTPAGTVEAQGGSFVVAQDDQGGWSVMTEAYEVAVVPRAGERAVLKAGEAVRMVAAGEEPGRVRLEETSADPELWQFELCNAFFADLEPFIQREQGFDREGLGDYLGLDSAFIDLDSGALVTDASPTIRPSVAGVSPAERPRPGDGEKGGRWAARRIWDWYDSLGTVKGVNYIPRTAVNSVEMWMAETFDPETIDEELGWARSAGYTSIRVQLQPVVWKADSDGFLDRVDRLLELAAKHGLRVVPVLFELPGEGGDEVGAAVAVGQVPASLACAPGHADGAE